MTTREDLQLSLDAYDARLPRQSQNSPNGSI